MTKISAYFWLYKSKFDKNGLSPIYFRITVNGKKSEIATGEKTKIINWDDKRGIIKGKGIDVEISNEKLNKLLLEYQTVLKSLLTDDTDLDAEIIKNKILKKDKKINYLSEIIQKHNENMALLIGKEYAKGTYERYKTVDRLLKEFLEKIYNQKDFLLQKLSKKFLLDFHNFLRIERKIGHNTTAKYIKNVKKIISFAIQNEWLTENPFIGYSITTKPVVKDFLSEEELEKIINKKISIERLNNVKTVFLFQCFTGLAYIDIFKLTTDNIQTIQGKKWLVTERTKTKIPVRVPLLKKALELIPESNNGKLFSIPTNQKMNAYLKELAAICGVNKSLSTHSARRTFASTVTLLNGVSIASVSKMLGHTKISTTQLYSKVVDKLLLNEMEKIDK